VAYLLGAVPLLHTPLLVQEQFVVLICNHGGRKRPRPFKSASSRVAPPKGVSTAQCDNLLVVETHTVEDVSQVLVSLFSIWQTSVGCTSSDILVHSSWPVWDDWALHLLDCADSTKDPEVGVGDPWELLCKKLSVHNGSVEDGRMGTRTLNGLQEVSSSLQSSIGSVTRLGMEPHRGSIASSSTSFLVIGSARMPRQSHQNWSIRSIIIVILLL